MSNKNRNLSRKSGPVLEKSTSPKPNLARHSPELNVTPVEALGTRRPAVLPP